jgi:flagellar biogenesis protein FliO
MRDTKLTQHVLRSFVSACRNFLSGVRSMRTGRRQRSMHLCETLPLGDRKYLALVEIDGCRFLVGAAPNSLSLLARFPGTAGISGSVHEPEYKALFEAEEYKTWR